MPRYKVICMACGHWENLPNTTRSGNCRSCGHDAVSVETILPPAPPPAPPEPIF